MDHSIAVKQKSSCCGCRACEQACPQKCITMIEDDEGFLYPCVSSTGCINCGVCIGACPMVSADFATSGVEMQPAAYAARHNDPDVLLGSTSGGAFTAIATAFCDGDSAIFGAAMGDDFVVRHTVIRDIAGLSVFRKSKYVQSDLGNSYSQARALLDTGVKVLFSGTPCQTAGLQKFLGKQYESLLCVEVLCHGVPSPKVFERYKDHLEQKYGNSIERFDFRDKQLSGWNIAMAVGFAGGKKVSRFMLDDDYGNAYLNSLCLRPCCHECPFAGKLRHADITIGDFWGIEKIMPGFAAGQGASLVLVNTACGAEVFSRARACMTVAHAELDAAAAYNEPLVRAALPNPLRDAFTRDVFKIPFDRASRKYQSKRSALRKTVSRLLSSDVKKTIKGFLKG